MLTVKPYNVILWDVYGTLLDGRPGNLAALTERGDELLGAFHRVVAHFGLDDSLYRFGPDRPPERTLRNMYIHGIEATHSRKQKQGVEHPEVRIEDIWLSILEIVARNGFKHELMKRSPLDFAREIALFFQRLANPQKLYPGVWETLLELHRRKVRQGIISNGQFYTRIELRELLRIESDGRIPTFHTVFDEMLVFLSCEFGFSKPNAGIFTHVRNLLRAEGFRPQECLQIGNDMLNDVWCPKQVGFSAVLFAGDEHSTRWRKDDPRCVELQPDGVIRRHAEILQPA